MIPHTWRRSRLRDRACSKADLIRRLHVHSSHLPAAFSDIGHPNRDLCRKEPTAAEKGCGLPSMASGPIEWRENGKKEWDSGAFWQREDWKKSQGL